jgi:ELWxxDGT repeat protein
MIVKDIVSGSGDSYPDQLANVNNTLYFIASDGTNGYELWTSDGTDAGTTMVKDIILDREVRINVSNERQWHALF